MVLPLVGLLGREALAEFLGEAASTALSGEGTAPSGPHQLNFHFEGIDNVIARLDSMTTRIEGFVGNDVLNEVQAWELEDVHRRNPKAMATMDGVEVVFFNRGNGNAISAPSRYQLRRARLARRLVFYQGQTSHRAVLRQALLDRLMQRLDRLMGEVLTWR